ncbi:MAG: helix-turn-helix domain-containing protein [Calditrichia bacterium]
MLLFFMSLGFVDHYYQANFNVLEYPEFLFIFNYTFLIAIPLLVIYVKMSTQKDFHISWGESLYFLPAILLTVFFFFDYHILSFDAKVQYIREIPNNPLIGYVIPLAGNLLCLLFLLITSRVLYRTLKHEDGLNRKVKANHRKLLWFLLLSFILFSCTGLLNFLFDDLLNDENTFRFIVMLEVLSWFMLSIALIYHGLDVPEVYLLQKEPAVKYQSSILKEADKATYQKKLLTFIHENQPYLNPELNISQLSELSAIPPKYLSQILNEEYGMNFFHFINSYRVDEVKRRLMNGEHHSKVLLSLALEAGFNSKAAFNRAFKKQTGITPTEFIKTLKNP